jgi:hypothetical protein
MDPRPLYTASQWAQDVLSDILTKRGGSEMEVTTIGIDLAKNVFAVCGAESSGRVVMRRQLRRAQVLSFMRGLPRCVVGMEASGGAQYWARQFIRWLGSAPSHLKELIRNFRRSCVSMTWNSAAPDSYKF